MVNKAVVLLSGGLDSATVLAMVKDEGYDCHALSFDYGQKARAELEASKAVCESLGVYAHTIFKLDIGQFGGSALTDNSINVPENEISKTIPITYVPARNTVFLSIALGLAEVLGAKAIYYGANVIDYSGYPDCRPQYREAFEELANLATKSGAEGHRISIRAPLMYLTKAEIIQKGIELNLDYSCSVSCYKPNELGEACGKCESCLIRKEGFLELNIPDPTRYIKN